MTEPGFLDDLRIASPCRANWDEMTGDTRVRYCGLCKKNVYDLRHMTRAESEALLRSEGEACVRMARRADGTVVTSDCPVGAEKKAKRQRVAAVVGGGLLAVTALLAKVRANAEPLARTLPDAFEVSASSLTKGAAPKPSPKPEKPNPKPEPKPQPKPNPEPIMMGAVAVPPPVKSTTPPTK
jgi:hypothetical protein